MTPAFVQFDRRHYSVLGSLVYRHMHITRAATESTHFLRARSVNRSRIAHIFITPTRVSD